MRNLLVLISLITIPVISGESSAAGKNVNINAGMVILANTHSDTKIRRYTCNAVGTKLRLAGYGSVTALNCSGNAYQFMTAANHGNLIIKVNSQTGVISDIIPK